MSYVDYSSQFVLDQFLTYLNANQLGSNDQHLYDNLAIEHNLNTATVDGTHKANSILGSYINKNPITATSRVLTYPGDEWVPTAGVYQIIYGDLQGVILELYISGSWRQAHFHGGLIYCDGTNMKFVSDDTLVSNKTVYYQKF